MNLLASVRGFVKQNMEFFSLLSNTALTKMLTKVNIFECQLLDWRIDSSCNDFSVGGFGPFIRFGGYINVADLKIPYADSSNSNDDVHLDHSAASMRIEMSVCFCK